MLGLTDDGVGEEEEQNIEGSPTDVQEYVVDDKVVTTTITPFLMGDDTPEEEDAAEGGSEEEDKQEDGDDDFGFDLKAPKRKNRRGGKSKYTPKRTKR